MATSDLISMVAFTSTTRCLLIGSQHLRVLLSVWQSCVGLRFSDLCVWCLATMQNAQLSEGARKLRSHFKPFVGQKFLKFWNNVGNPSYFRMPLPDCLSHVSFRRYSPLSLEVVEKPNKCKSFWPPIFREKLPRLFYGILLAWFTVHRVAKFDQSSICWSPSAKPGNEIECRIHEGWVKMLQVQF